METNVSSNRILLRWVTYGVKAVADREVETNVSSNRILPRDFAATAADAAVAATSGNVLPAIPCDRTNKTVSTFPVLNAVAALAFSSVAATTAAVPLQQHLTSVVGVVLVSLGILLVFTFGLGPAGHPDTVSSKGSPP